MPSNKITLAEQLKQAGYSSAAIGKWLLDHKEEYLPTNNGLDYYFGISYSNDMDIVEKFKPVDYAEFWENSKNIKP